MKKKSFREGKKFASDIFSAPQIINGRALMKGFQKMKVRGPTVRESG